MKHTLASTGHKEHKSKVFGALASHLSAEGAGLAGGPSLGAPKAEARRFHVVAVLCWTSVRYPPSSSATGPANKIHSTEKGAMYATWPLGFFLANSSLGGAL